MSRFRFAKTMVVAGVLSLTLSLPGMVNACGLACAGTCPFTVIPGPSTTSLALANAFCAPLTCTGVFCGCGCASTATWLTCSCQ